MRGLFSPEGNGPLPLPARGGKLQPITTRRFCGVGVTPQLGVGGEVEERALSIIRVELVKQA